MLRLFLELSSLSFQRQLSYRAAAIAGLLTNLFFGVLRIAVLMALYAGRPQIDGMSAADAITYTGLTQAIIAYLALFNWYEVIHSVNSGEVASDLLKPMDYFTFWLAKDFGRALAALVQRGLTLMLLYWIFVGVSVPASPQHWLAFLAALLLAWLVSFSWRFLLNLSAFWTPNAIGIARFAFILSWFLSGFTMPLRFFPDWFLQLCYLTPFPHMINTVVEIYLGLLDGREIALALFAQIAWILGLFLLIQVTLRLGVRRLVIQGG